MLIYKYILISKIEYGSSVNSIKTISKVLSSYYSIHKLHNKILSISYSNVIKNLLKYIIQIINSDHSTSL